MNALKWLCSGGGGHEDGEAMTCAALLLEAATDERVLRPSSIELLMHCYYTPSPHPEASEACMQSAMGQLREYGLVNDKGEVTDRGTAHCKAMMYLSLPEQIWVPPIKKLLEKK